MERCLAKPNISSFPSNMFHKFNSARAEIPDASMSRILTVLSAFSFSLCFILFRLTQVAASSSESESPRVLILLQENKIFHYLKL